MKERMEMNAIMKVLIVDDEAYVRDGIEKNLPWAQLGVDRVFKAATGREGLCMAEEYQPDVIISDVRMPQMDGLSMARTLCERFPGAKLIFISAYSEIDYYRSAMKLHAVGFIEKPIILEELSAEVRRAIDMIRLEKRSGGAKEGEHTFLRLLHGAAPDEFGKRFSVFVVGRIEMPESEAIRKTLQTALGTEVFCGTAGRHFVAIAEGAAETAGAVQILMRLGAAAFVTRAQANAASQVGIAYESAAARQEYQFYFPKAHFCDIQDEFVLKSPPAVFDAKFAQAFSGCVQSGDFSRASALVSAEMEKLVSPRLCAPEYARMSVAQLMRLAAECFERGGVSCGNENAELARIETFEEIRAFALSRIGQMFDFASDLSESGRVVYLIKREIETNFTNPAFTIAVLARRLHFSESYLGSLFKRHTSMTIGGYLNQIRMEHAKRLLLDPARKVSEVGEMVGIDNTDYFTRRFKQYTGRTPSEYRR